MILTFGAELKKTSCLSLLHLNTLWPPELRCCLWLPVFSEKSSLSVLDFYPPSPRMCLCMNKLFTDVCKRQHDDCCSCLVYSVHTWLLYRVGQSRCTAALSNGLSHFTPWDHPVIYGHPAMSRALSQCTMVVQDSGAWEEPGTGGYHSHTRRLIDPYNIGP